MTVLARACSAPSRWPREAPCGDTADAKLANSDMIQAGHIWFLHLAVCFWVLGLPLVCIDKHHNAFLYETKQQQMRIKFLHHCKLKKLVASQKESQKSTYTHPYIPPKVALASKSNLRFATVMSGRFDGRVARRQIKFTFRYSLGDRQHVFDERVAQRQMKFAVATVLRDRHHVFEGRVAQ